MIMLFGHGIANLLVLIFVSVASYLLWRCIYKSKNVVSLVFCFLMDVVVSFDLYISLLDLILDKFGYEHNSYVISRIAATLVSLLIFLIAAVLSRSKKRAATPVITCFGTFMFILILSILSQSFLGWSSVTVANIGFFVTGLICAVIAVLTPRFVSKDNGEKQM